jgi:hypothetical protein
MHESPTELVEANGITTATRVSEQVAGLLPTAAPGEPDDCGVVVTADDTENWAEVSFHIPAGLGQQYREALAPFNNLRFHYTENDRIWDEAQSDPRVGWLEPSTFADAVSSAYHGAQDVLETAIWAHAESKNFIPHAQPTTRNDSKYDEYGPDLRQGLLDWLRGPEEAEPKEPARSSLSVSAQLRPVLSSVASGVPHRGVIVTMNNDDNWAEVSLDIPAAMSPAFRKALAPFDGMRFEYTDTDRVWDDAQQNPPAYWDKASAFARAVVGAYFCARDAVEAAVWAHANAKELILTSSPIVRSDAMYDAYGSDLRQGLTESLLQPDRFAGHERGYEAPGEKFFSADRDAPVVF